MIQKTMERLMVLEGTWKGTGAGQYPTIEAFEYEEWLRFEVDRSYPMLHFEQRTFLTPDREPSHWEFGFIRPQDDGTVEISIAQDSGRVEVLRCRIVTPDNPATDLQLEGQSIVLGHDSRLVETHRTFIVRDDALRYQTRMATRTTPVPEMMLHLTASLVRSRDTEGQ